MKKHDSNKSGKGLAFSLTIWMMGLFLCPRPCMALCMTDMVVRDSLTVDAADRLDDETTVFKPTQLVAPLSLMTVGAVSVGRSYNHCVKNKMSQLRSGHYAHIDNTLQYLPAIAFMGMDYCGVRAVHPFRERLMLAATSHLITATMVLGVKFSVKSLRPDGTAYNSFPSGHTALVFTGAELVRKEYGTIAGLAAYGMAASVGALRMYNERHWLCDVLAGAGIGILSAKAAYWLLPMEKKLLGVKGDKRQMAVIAAPYFDGRLSGMTASLCVGF